MRVRTAGTGERPSRGVHLGQRLRCSPSPQGRSTLSVDWTSGTWMCRTRCAGAPFGNSVTDRGVPVATTERQSRTTDRTDRTRHPVYSVLIGLATLGVLLQGLWAGLFVHEGQDFEERWVKVHALDGEITIALAALATVVAFFLLRRRRMDLVVGTAVFTVLLVLEAYIGG